MAGGQQLPEQYTPSQIARFFHDLPHLNVSLHSVNNTFNPHSEIYLEVRNFCFVLFCLFAKLKLESVNFDQVYVTCLYYIYTPNAFQRQNYKFCSERITYTCHFWSKRNFDSVQLSNWIINNSHWKLSLLETALVNNKSSLNLCGIETKNDRKSSIVISLFLFI